MVPTAAGYDCDVVPFRDHSGSGLRGDPRGHANDRSIDAGTNHPWTVRHRDPCGDPCPCGRGPWSAIANDPCCDGATSPCGAVRATWSDPCGYAFRRRDRGCGVSTTFRDDHDPCDLRWMYHFQPPAIRPPSCTVPRASPRRQNLRPPSCFSSSSSSSTPFQPMENCFLCRFTDTSSVNSTCRKCRGCWATVLRYF